LRAPTSKPSLIAEDHGDGIGPVSRATAALAARIRRHAGIHIGGDQMRGHFFAVGLGFECMALAISSSRSSRKILDDAL